MDRGAQWATQSVKSQRIKHDWAHTVTHTLAPSQLSEIRPTPYVGFACDHVKRSDLEHGLESCCHILYRQSRCAKGLEKIYQCTLFTGFNAKDCLLPVVPQVIIKLIHLEANKFSDINKLFGKQCYLCNFLTWKYVSYCMIMHTSSRVIDTLLKHTKQLSN